MLQPPDPQKTAALCKGLDSIVDFGNLFELKRSRAEYTRLRQLWHVVLNEAAAQTAAMARLAHAMASVRKLRWAVAVGFHDLEYSIPFLERFWRALAPVRDAPDAPEMTLFAPESVSARVRPLAPGAIWRPLDWAAASQPRWNTFDAVFLVGQELFLHDACRHMDMGGVPLVFLTSAHVAQLSVIRALPPSCVILAPAVTEPAPAVPVVRPPPARPAANLRRPAAAIPAGAVGVAPPFPSIPLPVGSLDVSAVFEALSAAIVPSGSPAGGSDELSGSLTGFIGDAKALFSPIPA